MFRAQANVFDEVVGKLQPFHSRSLVVSVCAIHQS